MPALFRVLVFLKRRQHRKILKRARVARSLAPGSNVPQKPAHDFPAPRLWKRVGKTDLIWPRKRTDLLGDRLLELRDHPLLGSRVGDLVAPDAPGSPGSAANDSAGPLFALGGNQPPLDFPAAPSRRGCVAGRGSPRN